MHDIKWIRDHPAKFDEIMARRGHAPVSHQILSLDQERRSCLQTLQELQSERNTLAKSIGQAKAKGEDASALMARTAALKAEIPTLETQERDVSQNLDLLLAGLPNALSDDVPDGPDESFFRLERRWGEKPQFTFSPKTHYELGEALGLMDFEGAARMSGARFVALKGDFARLERALASFMLDLHEELHGYTPVSPPLLVRDAALFGTGQLPKFAQDSFQTTDGRWLIPTAEVSLTNLVREQVLDDKDLPYRYTAHTPCFRSEAGSAGRDTRGMMRHHQFYKVELVSITRPEDSPAEHERMVGAAEEVLKRLKLPYQVITLPTGDTGATALKTYDLEVWLPGEQAYREISSCSNTGSYQARRMGARYRKVTEGGAKPALDFVHTLNGSGVAVGRALIAVVENYQQKDGSILIPEVLRPYMGQRKVICHA